MEAFIRIGDFTLTVVEGNYPDAPRSHVISAHDTFKVEGGLEFAAHVVADEAEAIEVVRAYLQLDGPDEAFRKLFPQFSS